MYQMPYSSVVPFDGKIPKIAKGVFLASGVHLIGDLEVGADTNFWFNTVVRADIHYIRIGERTNIQDNSVVHITGGVSPTIIGSDVTIGHNAIIHACTIEDLCLIGMGAIVMDKALIRSGSLVAGGSVVPPGKDYPPGYLIKGSPAVASRKLTDQEIEEIKKSAIRYVGMAKTFMKG